MSQVERAKQFATLHVKGAPVVLYNAWDAGSAAAIARAGAAAIATSSWAVAAALGYGDGEQLPLALVEQVAEQVVRAARDLPVSVDFEGGYAVDPEALGANLSGLLERGVIGINFEDRVVDGKGLHAIDAQARRIAALRRAADARGVPLFINARTDLFLGRGDADPAKNVEEALARARAYAEAGASGYFVPGLVVPDLIRLLGERAGLPLNVMVSDRSPSLETLRELGVSRVSHGANPYAEAIKTLGVKAARIYGRA